MAGTDGDATPTLVEWAGGPPAIARLIDAFYDRVERDELLSPFFPGGVTQEHRRHVASWWTEVFGGPADYTDRLGGYDRMLAHHRSLAITGEQRLRFATTMSQAADDAGLPADPEFRAALVGYLEWGTRLAHGELAAGRHAARTRTGPAVGLGRRSAVHPLTDDGTAQRAGAPTRWSSQASRSSTTSSRLVSLKTSCRASG